MASYNSKRVVDGFPFPYQRSPATTKHAPEITTEELACETASSPPSPSPTEYLDRSGELGSLVDYGASPIRSFNSSNESKHTVVIRGGFGPPIKFSGTTTNGMRCYPPLPNSAYGLTSQAYIPHNANVTFKVLTPATVEEDAGEEEFDNGLYIAGRDSAGGTNVNNSGCVKDLDGHQDERMSNTTAPKERHADNFGTLNDYVYYPPPRQPLTLSNRPRAKQHSDFEPPLNATNLPKTKTRGEKLAGTINFNRPAWVMTSPGISGDLYPGEEQRADYIKNVDRIDEEKWELEYCRICKTSHIPPGTPINLEDRDTCGANLPEWFPNDEFERPWYSFNKLMNEAVKLEEIQQGFNHRPNPDQPFWDLQFHEYSSRWKAIGKRGGWWKCRDGEEATDVEKNCHLCHSEIVATDRAADAVRREVSVAQRLANIQSFIEERMKVVGERDKALALAEIRAEGYPQYLGPRTIDDVNFERPGLVRTATMAGTRSHYSVDGDATPNGWGSPVRGRSPPRGRSMERRGSEDQPDNHRPREK